ncbi:MAG TPA: DUF3558 family protein [Streptosporangiaceae bacterium]|jgi:hypothetical protein
MNRRTAQLALVIAAALALGACSGSASPARPATSLTASAPAGDPSGGAAPNAASASPTAAANVLATVNPCLVLTAGTVQKYQVTAGKPSGLKQDLLAPSPQTVVPYCALEVHDGGLYVLDVQMELQAGLGDLRDSSSLSVSAGPAIDGHPTRLVQFTAKAFAYCVISVGVTSTSRSDLVMANGTGNFAPNCAEARKIAPLVIPQLPASTG